MIGICVRLKFENVNYSSEINHADAQTGLWFYYIITKLHPPFQNPGSAPEVIASQRKSRQVYTSPGQTESQVKRSFSPFGHPTQVNAS